MESAGSPPTFRRKLETFWPKFRKTIYFRALLLVLVSTLAVLLLQSPLLCFSLILIPLMVLLIPHWFGERSVKNHAFNGLIFLVLGTVLYAAILTPSIVSLPQQELTGNQDANGNPAIAVMTQGGVNPFRAPAGTTFTFSVNVSSNVLTGTQYNLTNRFSVITQVASIDGLAETIDVFNMSVDTSRSPGWNFSRGVYFTYSTNALPANVHFFDFAVVRWNSSTRQIDVIVVTQTSIGPFMADFWGHFNFMIFRGLIQFAFLVFGFFLILLIYWWTRRARQIRGVQERKAETKRAEGGGEFTCTNCGADVSEADTKCPKCGAVFESEAAGEAAKPIEPK